MAWARFDDQFPDHPKVLAAGPEASWLYVCGVCYCARLLTDGFIPQAQVRKLADLDEPMEHARTLVDVGLWEITDGGFRVHDYLEYNPTKDHVERVKAARAEAGAVGGKQSGIVRASKTEANCLDNGSGFASSMYEAKSNPIPSPPLPSGSPSPTPPNTEDYVAPSAPKERKKRAPFIEPTLEEIRAYLTTLGEEHHADAMYDHYRTGGWTYGKAKKPVVDWQAAARTFVRMRHEYDAERFASKRNGNQPCAEQTLDEMAQEELEALTRIHARREANR